MKQYLIAPSILSADFARLGEDTAKALAAGADVVHFDVMDNHYVPNLTIGPMVLKALRNYGVTAPIDVHLMVKPVDRIVPDFAAAGNGRLSSRNTVSLTRPDTGVRLSCTETSMINIMPHQKIGIE